jgi:hypothetical protein
MRADSKAVCAGHSTRAAAGSKAKAGESMKRDGYIPYTPKALRDADDQHIAPLFRLW